MLSPYRILPISHKRRQKISNTNLDDNSNREPYLKRTQTTSKDLKIMNSNLLLLTAQRNRKAEEMVDPCMRLVKLTMNIQMKIFILLNFKRN